jgi:ADP-ribosyl-[dinitrogen reductase] hydrolase
MNERPLTTQRLTSQQTDRAVGSIVGMATGDALGAGYEFGPPLADATPVNMIGGGDFDWQPGEWTDDTSMAVPILDILAAGRSFDEEALDDIVAAWIIWASDAKDVGIQTHAVFSGMTGTSARSARQSAREVHDISGRSAGNGSLMRTAPVALGFLHPDAEQDLAAAARAISDLTHYEADAGDACVIWTLAIRHAILTGKLDVRVGLDWLEAPARDRWKALIDEAETRQPRDFDRNGWAVEALQGSWSAIHHSTGLVDALERAVRGGRDTDTVAAITGSLIGAAKGVSGIPARWRRILQGWPGITARDLVMRSVLAVRAGVVEENGWPTAERFPRLAADTLVRHPHDGGVWLASLAALDRLPEEVDVVISLCRVGTRETHLETVEFWLVNQTGANTDPQFVLEDAADTIAALRAENKIVVVHCAEGRSRVPAVAATYSVRHRGHRVDAAFADILDALPGNRLNPEFRAVVSKSARPLSEP